uniref:Uncharacterized protein n=1 Tax=Talaromyces marneffei PM1 TaxID=1077442 RepID=A0A093UZR1_TALMA
MQSSNVDAYKSMGQHHFNQMTRYSSPAVKKIDPMSMTRLDRCTGHNHIVLG